MSRQPASRLAAPFAIALALACAPDAAVPSDVPMSDTGSPSDSGGGADAGADDAPTAACGRVGVATGLTSFDTMVAGRPRHYQLFVPPSYDASVASRLVFIFHGLGGDGDQIRLYLSLESVADAPALFVYPDGLPVASLGGQTGWAVDDLAFFDTMLAEISASYCVDSERVFATGHSFGGYMTNVLGCQRGDVVRAIAPVSGGTLPGTCRGPVPVWLLHGASDTTVLPSEGIAARDAWLTTNGCASTSMPTTPADCVAYDCPAAGVTWCSFAGGHFPLPSYTRPAIWEFFAGL